jgi:probable HAF family extracellular repeat protein
MGTRIGRGASPQAGLVLMIAGAALNGLSCGGGDLPLAPASGIVTITTSTTGPEPDADGYAFTIDGGTETTIAASATLQRDNIEPGNHSIQLTGMAPNCTVAGENPRTVSIPAGETVTVTFELTCRATTGSLQVTSATSGALPDADGYTMTVDGVDRGTLVASGAVASNGLAPGAHAVGLSGVAGNCQVQGDNPRSITIIAGASVTAAFEIVCTEPPSVTGTLKITTATAGPDQDGDGYSFAIDAGATQSIGLNATTSVTSVATGAHTVRLSGAARNCGVGGTNPRAVTVAAGGTAEVSFAITCTATTASVEITTVTKGAKPDADGYTVSVDHGNAQAIGAAATVAIPTLPPGSHAFALAAIAGNCRVEGENPRTLTVSAGQKAATTFTVLCPTFGSYRETEIFALTGEDFWGYVTDINSAGQVVFTSCSEDDCGADLWHNGVNTNLSPPDAWYTVATAINSGGQVVGHGYNLIGELGYTTLAWLWNHDVMTALDPEADVRDINTSAYDINAAGQVVGVYDAHAALWENGSMIDLGTLGGTASVAFGIDPAGRVVGQSDRANGEPHAFLWENGVMTDLNIPGDASTGRSINAAGQVVGTVLRNGVIHGFLWEKGATIDLGEVLEVDDINAAGQVVGTRRVERIRRAFVWEKGVMTDLPGPSAAGGINDGGVVVGSSWGRTENEFATLWTPE